MITRDLIIKKATQLFLSYGVKTVTIDKIVKELHTSKRTIYKHFKDKTETTLGLFWRSITPKFA